MSVQINIYRVSNEMADKCKEELRIIMDNIYTEIDTLRDCDSDVPFRVNSDIEYILSNWYSESSDVIVLLTTLCEFTTEELIKNGLTIIKLGHCNLLIDVY